MKNIFLLIALIYSGNTNANSSITDSIYAKTGNLNKSTFISLPNEVKIILPNELTKTKTDWTKEYLPAILTFLAGMLTVIANAYISKKLREATRENMESQLKESQRLKEIEIRNSINIKNRQEWMNQFRDNLSEFGTIIALVLTDIKSGGTDEKLREEIKILFVSKFKLNLLLQPDREDEKKLLSSLDKIIEYITINIDKRNGNYVDEVAKTMIHVTTLSRKILERNWQKLNKFE